MRDIIAVYGFDDNFRKLKHGLTTEKRDKGDEYTFISVDTGLNKVIYDESEGIVNLCLKYGNKDSTGILNYEKSYCMNTSIVLMMPSTMHIRAITPFINKHDNRQLHKYGFRIEQFTDDDGFTATEVTDFEEDGITVMDGPIAQYELHTDKPGLQHGDFYSYSAIAYAIICISNTKLESNNDIKLVENNYAYEYGCTKRDKEQDAAPPEIERGELVLMLVDVNIPYRIFIPETDDPYRGNAVIYPTIHISGNKFMFIQGNIYYHDNTGRLVSNKWGVIEDLLNKGINVLAVEHWSERLCEKVSDDESIDNAYLIYNNKNYEYDMQYVTDKARPTRMSYIPGMIKEYGNTSTFNTLVITDTFENSLDKIIDFHYDQKSNID